jgi:acetolactate synthase small subunit
MIFKFHYLPKTAISKSSLIFVALSLAISSCTPEKRAMLRATAENFRSQAVEAITTYREINQLELRTATDDDLDNTIAELLNNPIIENNRNDGVINFQQLDVIILGDKNQPSELDAALDNLQAEYDKAVEVFTNLESIDYGSSKIVAQTAQPARCLTVKMLRLAQLLQENPPKPKNPERADIGLALIKLRQNYRQTNISATQKQEIENQVGGLINQWRNLDLEEKEMIETAIAKFIVAADKGQRLSKLIDEYPRLSFDVISARITQILSLTTNITGNNYGSLTAKINNLEQEIKSDPILSTYFIDVVNGQSKPDKSQLKCQI